MPYIKKTKRDKIKNYVHNVENAGDLNYLITLVILKTWNEAPRYSTLHGLRREYMTDMKSNPLLQKLRSDFAHIFTVADIYAASMNAFEEFYRRVGAAYEDGKITANGDLEEYQEALKLPVQAPSVEQPQ